MKLEIDTTQPIEDIIKQVEKAKAEQEPKRWRAEAGEEFYTVAFCHKILCFEEMWEAIDNKLYEIGNYFKTSEEAEQEARLRNFEQRVAARIRELNSDKIYKFIAYSSNWTVNIDLEGKEVLPELWRRTLAGQRGWWSDKKEAIEQVIQEFGEKNFIKWAEGRF